MVTLDEAQEQGIVLGLNEVTGEVRERLDVDELLLRHPKTFNLYLLALADLQNEATSNKDKMGWFQIAGMLSRTLSVKLLMPPCQSLGIHGLPKKDWDGVAGNSSKVKGGYCPHGTILFPTWHRPYLAMMEVSKYRNDVTYAAYDDPANHLS